MLRFSGLLLLLLSVNYQALALPRKCLQLPSRVEQCPRLIYKKAAIPVAALEVEKGQIICLCLSDLQNLTQSTTSAVEKIDRQVTFDRLLKKYQLTEQDILTLINY